MKFGHLQKAYFNADDGAYSVVTARERYDGQITLTVHEGESALLINHFGADKIPRKSSQGNPLPLLVRNKQGLEKQSALTINHPKQKGNELRIYRKAAAGFDFEEGEIWFIFRKNEGLVVGSMTESNWRDIGKVDSTDEEFQREVETGSTGKITYVEFAGRTVARDAALANKAIDHSGYVCEFTGLPTPFLSRRTGKPYLEAHHLIPLGFQDDFGQSLDTLDNIFALNPLWHRAIHHATHGKVREILETLSQKRPDLLHRYEISRDDLIHLYGCEEIA